MLIDVPKVVAEAATVTPANLYELLFHHTYDASVWGQILLEWGGKEAKPKYEPQMHGPVCPHLSYPTTSRGRLRGKPDRVFVARIEASFQGDGGLHVRCRQRRELCHPIPDQLLAAHPQPAAC